MAKDPNYMALSRGKTSSIDAYSTSFGSIRSSNSERALKQINSVQSERISRVSSIERGERDHRYEEQKTPTIPTYGSQVHSPEVRFAQANEQ
jgi:hypothetical protein